MRIQLFLLLLAFRVLNSAFIQTSFNPDEYWQSLEVAHRMVFGYGHLTWEWTAGIRSILHPAIFACCFYPLKLLGIDTATSLRACASLLQSAAAALTDLYVYCLADKLHGPATARWALTSQLLCWFNLFCLPRTFSNCLETLCTTAAVYHWPHLLPRSLETAHITHTHAHAPGNSTKAQKHKLGDDAGKQQPQQLSMGEQSDKSKHKGERLQRSQQHRFLENRLLALSWAAAGVLLRPSSAMFWLVVGLRELVTCSDVWRLLAAEVLPVGLVAVAGSMLLDQAFFGRWVMVPLEFFKFNVMEGGSALYGAHPWHWNFTQALPTVAGPLLPLLLYGTSLTPTGKALGMWATIILCLYSLPAHKEFRFLLPALQLLLVPCGSALHHLHTAAAAAAPGRWGKLARRGALLCLALNLPMALYFCLVHQRGGLAAMKVLEAEAKVHDGMSVLMLMPCHSTPLYSHLHRNVPLHFLDCSPPGYAAQVRATNQLPSPTYSLPAGISSDSNFFMEAPLEYLGARFNGETFNHSHVIAYDGQAQLLAGWLGARGCKEFARLFNAHLSNGHDLQKEVVMFSCM